MNYVVWIWCGLDMDIRSEHIFIAAVSSEKAAAEAAAAAINALLEEARQVHDRWAVLPTIEDRGVSWNAMRNGMLSAVKKIVVADPDWPEDESSLIDLVEYGGEAKVVAISSSQTLARITKKSPEPGC